jgi:predicted ribosomally synthesized peptide with SipW-like signal peptide
MKNNLKIGIILLVLAIAVIGSGYVYAYFSDQQKASNNVFTSGTLTLQVGSQVICTDNITATNLVPGNTFNGADWQIQNTGSVNGNLSIDIGAIINNENGVNNPETISGDTTTGATQGELGANLIVAFWMDVNNNNICDNGDYYLPYAGGNVVAVTSTGIPALANSTLNNYANKQWNNASVNKGLGTIGYFMTTYSLPAATTNVIQGDSCVFPITFTLNQTI